MKKLLFGLLVTSALNSSAQTLFYYGNDSVSVEEFMAAYQKNSQTGNLAKTSIEDYLDLYIASRLKVKEAMALGYDTLPQLNAELVNLRQQLAPTFLIDRNAITGMVQEAFARSQKDILVSHIFISNANPQLAEQKLKAYQIETDRGTSFGTIAKNLSDDPSAKDNMGSLGYVTVYGLPYALESVVYNLKDGEVSKPFASTAGWHILKKEKERPAVGRIRASQILLAFPPEASAKEKDAVRFRADSIYNALKKGSDFGALATTFSNDVVSAASNGRMVEFGVGEYEPEFEAQVFGLKSNGEISKPFLTSHGYHIVRRDETIPVKTVMDENTSEILRQKIEQGDRMRILRSALAQRVLQASGAKDLFGNRTGFFQYSDSIINGFRVNTSGPYIGTTPVLRLDNHELIVSEWISHAQTHRYKPDGSGVKSYDQLWNEFRETSALEHYQMNLEQLNPEFRRQIREFRDGNLFFEVMQQKIWGPSQNDSVGLLQYFENHRDQYKWNASADAVVFYADNAGTANDFIANLKKNPAKWRTMVEAMNEKIAADSGRFEIANIPNAKSAKAGSITKQAVNENDGTVSFAYIVKKYSAGDNRTFTEAKGLVVNDYQQVLDKQWVEELKKKYPVRMNDSAKNSLGK